MCVLAVCVHQMHLCAYMYVYMCYVCALVKGAMFMSNKVYKDVGLVL